MKRWIGDTLCALRASAETDEREVVGAWWRRGEDVRYRQLENVSNRPEQEFEVKSEPLIELEQEGWVLAAIGHSHPGGLAKPSKLDVQMLELLENGVPGIKGFILARDASLPSGWQVVEYDAAGNYWRTSTLRAFA